MHKKFDSSSIEKKWQKIWEGEGIYNVGERDSSKEKEYVLVEWPYPSGNLHLGHWYAFAVPDIYARYKRMIGKQVLFPMGFDAFGLPAENAAIKRGLDPKAWTNDNIAYMRKQLVSMGNSFSWDKTTSSIDPDYYKWTQWMFTQFFENEIAYRGKGKVNWCEGCHTVIANEQVLADDTCERCGTHIDKKEMPQWMLKITKYADRLIDDLVELNWPEHIKEAQRQWIGRSKGAEIDFTLSTNEKITIFTTRPDTLYGATYMVLAPEHPLLEKNQNQIKNWNEVETYIKTTKQKNEQDRLDATKEKTGVKLEGITAINPANNEEIPVYIADYVLGGYGTGAIMAVPAHDERDFAFAKKYGLEVRQVVASAFCDHNKPIEYRRVGVYGLIENENSEYLMQYFRNRNHWFFPGGGMEEGETEMECLQREIREETGFKNFSVEKKLPEIYYNYVSRNGTPSLNRTIVYVLKVNTKDVREEIIFTPDEIKDGIELKWVSSEELNEIKNIDDTRSSIIKQVLSFHEGEVFTKNGVVVNSGEFDGMNSEEAKEAIVKKVGGRMTSTYRLRDWSIGRQRYWGVPIPIVYSPSGESHAVPREHLPWLLPEDVDFTPTGEPPLAKSEALKKRTEEIFGKGWTPEVETMDTFVDSSWYFLRFFDNKNGEVLSDLEKQKAWMPVDMYFGGAEHTTMHLLYSRFWHKALFDLGLVTEVEPFKRRVNRGLILGTDGNKMSKSKGNVIDPDEQVERVGADTVKMYLAFMGPYEGANYPFDLGGIAGIRRFLERVYGLGDHIVENESEETVRMLHKTIRKVCEDVEQFKFNTAISALMVFVNHVERSGLSLDSYSAFLRLVAPFAPHLTEELWREKFSKTSIHGEVYPEADESMLVDELVTIGVQINGKLRGQITISPEADEEEAKNTVINNPDLQKYLESGSIAKFIYVKGRIVNVVLR